MGIEQVSSRYRPLDFITYGVDEFDIARMELHHVYNPERNMCLLELKIPAIRRMITDASFDKILESIVAKSLHGLFYDSVSNEDFYNFMHKEENIGAVDKVRRYDDDHAYTFYFSSIRQLMLYSHDYFMATIVYLNYPFREFNKRTPCKFLDPQCEKCPEYLAEPVRNYLDEEYTDGSPAEEFNIKFDDVFFTNIEENHRLLMAYTIEKKKKPGECFTTDEPEYFIQNMSVPYFTTAIKRKVDFQTIVLKERREEQKNMYALVERGGLDFEEEYDEDPITYENGSYTRIVGVSGAVEYNSYSHINVPAELHDAIHNSNFTSLWKFDFRSMNGRNTIFKYQHNHWVVFCSDIAEDGFWCAWNAYDEIVKPALEDAGGGPGTAAVEVALSQVANMFGWGSTGDMSSTDKIYFFSSERIDGINYEDIVDSL